MSHSSATCGSLTLFLSCLLTSEFIWIVCAVQKLHMQSSRLLKGIFWQKNNCVEARNTLAQMHMLRKELWHGFVVHKHNHDCRLAQGMTHAPPLSHTHMISPQIPCPLQSEHMSFPARWQNAVWKHSSPDHIPALLPVIPRQVSLLKCTHIETRRLTHNSIRHTHRLKRNTIKKTKTYA